jgi:hypothetical protein
MKPASVLVLSIAFLSSFCYAQYDPPEGRLSSGWFSSSIERTIPNENKTSTNYTLLLSRVCPIGLTAQHVADGSMVNTAIRHPKGVGQALHLSLTDPEHGQISQATVLVRGWTPKGRVTQSAASPDSNTARRQQTQLKPDGKYSVADLWISGLSAITSIEVISATYADGSKWTPSADLACRVAPDLFMAVIH